MSGLVKRIKEGTTTVKDVEEVVQSNIGHLFIGIAIGIIIIGAAIALALGG